MTLILSCGIDLRLRVEEKVKEKIEEKIDGKTKE